jgi:hypothetical protein
VSGRGPEVAGPWSECGAKSSRFTKWVLEDLLSAENTIDQATINAFAWVLGVVFAIEVP